MLSKTKSPIALMASSGVLRFLEMPLLRADGISSCCTWQGLMVVLAPLFPGLFGEGRAAVICWGRDCQAKMPLCWAMKSHHKHKFELAWHPLNIPRTSDLPLRSRLWITMDFHRNSIIICHPYHSFMTLQTQTDATPWTTERNIYKIWLKSHHVAVEEYQK